MALYAVAICSGVTSVSPEPIASRMSPPGVHPYGYSNLWSAANWASGITPPASPGRSIPVGPAKPHCRRSRWNASLFVPNAFWRQRFQKSSPNWSNTVSQETWSACAIDMKPRFAVDQLSKTVPDLSPGAVKVAGQS